MHMGCDVLLGHDSAYVTRPIHMYNMTFIRARDCVFIVCVCVCVCVCDMTPSYLGHDLFICVIHMCDMTHSYVRHDSFMCDMTYSYVGHASFICG